MRIQSPRKYFLIDANVLIDYYMGENSLVCKTFDDLENRRKNQPLSPLTIFVPNFCIVEVYKALATRRYCEGVDHPLNEPDYKRIVKTFSYDISRSDHWSGIDDRRVKEKESLYQKYYHLELSRYHVLNTQLIYPFMSRVFSKEDKHHLSTIDILIIAQGIELTKYLGRSDCAILTSDKKLINLGRILLSLKGSDLKSHGLMENACEFYPAVLDARDFNAFKSFLRA